MEQINDKIKVVTLDKMSKLFEEGYAINYGKTHVIRRIINVLTRGI